MVGKNWTLDDIPWSRFDPTKVDGEILKIVKAASMVEYNGADYGSYLCSVFSDDPEFQAAARAWADEETRHGLALARWAGLADPEFDFDRSFQRFLAGYRIPTEARQSVRGSRAGELVARCIVEVGTSSYYTALSEASKEPVLTAICRAIAADEFRHYKLFYDHMKRYLEIDGIGRLRRILVALGRVGESEDDELAYAYYAANGEGEPYNRKRWSRAYLNRAASYYHPRHIRRATSMTFKAVGLDPQSRLVDWVVWAGYRVVRARVALARI